MARTTFLISDVHAVHWQDTAQTLVRKRKASECIAQCIERTEGDVAALFTGDIVHRPDMPEVEGFNPVEAQKITRPMVDVIAEKNAKTIYIPGNCDPWAGMKAHREELRAIFDPGHKIRNLSFSDGVHLSDDLLATHGHIFEAPLTAILSEALPFLKNSNASRRAGMQLKRAIKDAVTVLEESTSREWDGSHRKAFWINRGIDLVLKAAPQMLRRAIDDWKMNAMNRCYTKAVTYGADQLLHIPRVVTMGHTHVATLLERDQLRELVDFETLPPEVYINTGTATGDRGRPSTFGMVAGDTVMLLQTDSPSRQPAVVVASAELTPVMTRETIAV